MSGAHPPASQIQVERRMSALNLTGSSLDSKADLQGWGSFSASSQLSVAELDSIVQQMKSVQSKSIDENIEGMLKKHCFKLAKVLVDAEVAQRFANLGGLAVLCHALNALKGSSLVYAVNALRTFSIHEFALDSLVQSFQVQTQLWQLVKANVSNIAVLKSLLTLLTEIVKHTSNGFGFVTSLHFQNGNAFFPLLVQGGLGKQAGLDVQVASLKLLNALLTSARDAKQFNAVLDELNSSGSGSSHNHAARVSFEETLNALKDDPSPALKDELSTFRAIQKTGFKAAEVSGLQRKEIAALKTQLADISQLATEYRSTTARLENELKNFKRREPLVQLLWAEIQQLRGALNVAQSAGFVYDLSDPNSRYVKPSHFAYIDRLDVARWAPGMGAGGGGGSGLGAGGGHGEAPSNAPHSVTVHAAPVSAPQKKVAGMRSGDDEEALADALSSAFSSPLGPGMNAPGTISYDLPGPPPDTEFTIPDAPPPEVGVAPPIAPPATGDFVSSSAPGAPPMAPAAPGAPGAPPMAPGAPAAPGAPRAGVQPTKKPVKPLRKMKPLHWTRILLPVGSDQSIWTRVEKRLPALESVLPISEIDALFAEPQKKAPGGEKEAPASPSSSSSSSTNADGTPASPRGGNSSSSSVAKKENQRFLSDKRFNAVAIMLSFLPAIDQVISAIQRLDLTVLDKDQVAALHKQMPSEEEIALITSSGCKPEELAKPEAFLLTLSSSIPCVGSRIDCWHFANSFSECVEDLKTPFVIISSAITAVRESTCLPVICAIVLHIGNFINGGSARGQADGFDLSVLNRLQMIKDSTGDSKGTMLNYVVSKVLDLEGLEFGNRFVSELAPCRGAAEFPLRPALAASTRFQGLIKTQKNLAALVIAGTENSTDPFNSFIAGFTKESEEEGNKLKQLGQQCHDAFGQLLFYLNPAVDATAAAKVQSEELFSTLYEFAEAVKLATEQRKAALEQQAQQRKQEEIRQRQQAARAKAAAEKAAATQK